MRRKVEKGGLIRPGDHMKIHGYSAPGLYTQLMESRTHTHTRKNTHLGREGGAEGTGAGEGVGKIKVKKGIKRF